MTVLACRAPWQRAGSARCKETQRSAAFLRNADPAPIGYRRPQSHIGKQPAGTRRIISKIRLSSETSAGELRAGGRRCKWANQLRRNGAGILFRHRTRSRLAITVNGVETKLEVAPWTTLLDALRDHLDLTGTKKGCDHGQCGACTVLVDGPAHQFLPHARGDEGWRQVTTIEGLVTEGALHPLRRRYRP